MTRAELVVEPDYNRTTHYSHLQISTMEVDDYGNTYIDTEDVPTNSQHPAYRQPAVERTSRIEMESDSDITLQADRILQASMLRQLESRQNIPMPVPAGSLIDKPVDLYQQALNDPNVLAWFESKGIALETLKIQEVSISATVTRNEVSSTETFTVWDTSGWWQVSAQVLAARQLLDPGDIGLPYVNEDRKLIPCVVMLDFYGVAPPTSNEEASALANRLIREGWPEITADEKVELDKECLGVKELIREAKARAQMVNELDDLVRDKSDETRLSLAGHCSESVGDSPLAHKCLAILHHLNDFFMLEEMATVCAGKNIDASSLPVRISENKIQVLIHPAQWYDLTDLVNDQVALTAPFKALLIMVKDTGNALYAPLSFDFQQILSFSGFTVPKTAGEVRNIIRWLQTSLPQATPLGDYSVELLADSGSPTRLTANERATVIRVTKEFLNGANSIIDALGADLLGGTSVEYRRKNADALLNKMFEKDQSDSWGHELLQALNWYGAAQTAAPEHYQKLLLAAIRLEVDPNANGTPGTIAGYDVYQAKNLGRDLTAVRIELELHLIGNKGVSAQAAQLVAHLFLADSAPEFLAQDLSAGIQVGTANWTTLCLGVAIAEVQNPGCSRVMTTEQLMALTLLVPTTPEQQLLFQCLGVDTLMTWGVMNGVIQQREDSSYSSQDYEVAAKKFTTQRIELSDAFDGFKRELVTRKQLAAIELGKVFSRYTDKPMEELNVESQQYEHFDVFPKPEVIEKSLVEVYMDGELSAATWQISNEPRLFDAFRNRPMLPDLNAILTKSVDDFTNARKHSLITSTKALIATLPLEDRQNLEFGDVTFFTLREESGKPKEDETHADRAALRGRQGTLIRCERALEVSYFEVFAGRMSIIKRTDLPDALPLNGKNTIEQARVGKGGTVNVDVQRGTELPFDFSAYSKGSEPTPGVKSRKIIIEQLGSDLPGRRMPEREQVPDSYFSNKTAEIADRIVNGNFLQGERDFLFKLAKGQTSAEENREYWDNVEGYLLQLIPLVGCINDLRSGDRIRFINGAFGLFTDLASGLSTVAGGVSRISTVLKSVAAIRVKAFETLKTAGTTIVAAINPLDGVPDLAAGGARVFGSFGKVLKSGAFTLTETSISRLQTCVDRLRCYFGGFANDAAITSPRHHAGVTGTFDGTHIKAILNNGNWYALDINGNPMGRSLDNFIALSSAQAQ